MQRIRPFGNRGKNVFRRRAGKNLPIDFIKLDAMFFREGCGVEREKIVISNFVRMAKEPRLKNDSRGCREHKTGGFFTQARMRAGAGLCFCMAAGKRKIPCADIKRRMLDRAGGRRISAEEERAGSVRYRLIGARFRVAAGKRGRKLLGCFGASSFINWTRHYCPCSFLLL